MALYRPPAWTAQYADPWRPGDWGKGFLTPEGLVHWSVGQTHDGWPFHSIMQNHVGVGRKMAEDGTYYGTPTVDFWIDPHGRVAYWNRPGIDSYVSSTKLPMTEKLNQVGQQINGYDPRLQSTNDWIDNQFYGDHGSSGFDWPCPRCNHPTTNADSSCPHCNYRPEEGSYFERGTASDPNSRPTPPPVKQINAWPWGDQGSIIQHHLKKLEELESGKQDHGYGFCPYCGVGLNSNEYMNHCPNCDATLQERMQAPEVGGQHCRECGDPLNASGDCLDCMANFGAGTAADWRELSRKDVGNMFERQMGIPNEQECPDCGEPLNDHGDCENPLCYMSPDFYGHKDSSAHLPQLIEAQSHPVTVANDPHHRTDRRPVCYLPHRNAIYVGQPATHHVQLKNEFEIPRHSGMYGYIRPQGIDWLNGVGMPEDVEDMLKARYLSNPAVLAGSWDLKEWDL